MMARWMMTLITGCATRRAPEATFRTCSFCAALATRACTSADCAALATIRWAVCNPSPDAPAFPVILFTTSAAA